MSLRQRATDGWEEDALLLPHSKDERVKSIKYKVCIKMHWSHEQYAQWWHKPNQHLGNRTPCAMTDNEFDLAKLEKLVRYACDNVRR
jgi:hypothetical protein